MSGKDFPALLRLEKFVSQIQKLGHTSVLWSDPNVKKGAESSKRGAECYKSINVTVANKDLRPVQGVVDHSTYIEIEIPQKNDATIFRKIEIKTYPWGTMCVLMKWCIST